MGKSLPPQASVDLVASYARRRGADVEIVLAEPAELVEGDVFAVLRRVPGGQRVQCTLTLRTDGGARSYVVTCPRSALTDGSWSIILRGDDQRQRVNARLLVQGDRPLCLLWGATAGPSRLPEPRPTLRSAARARLRPAARVARGAARRLARVRPA